MYGQLAGRLMPYLMKAGGSNALPWLMRGGAAVAGGAPSLLQGDLGGAILGGGLGAASTLGMRGLGTALTNRGAAATAGLIGRTGIGAQRGLGLAGNLANQEFGAALAGAAIPVATGMGIQNITGRVGGAVRDRLGGTASGQLTGRGDPNSGDVLGSGNLPPGTIDRMIGPQGNYWYRLDPAGVPAGDRLGRQLDARANANVMNILGDTGFAQTERMQKADLARQAAAKQLKENIEMARKMSEASQASGFNMAENMNKGVATAMMNRNNFNYFQ
tara:strand:- start:1282 stop:2103 length:822 start_codon:yes stop_codon:yes gene_type:complete